MTWGKFMTKTKLNTDEAYKSLSNIANYWGNNFKGMKL